MNYILSTKRTHILKCWIVDYYLTSIIKTNLFEWQCFDKWHQLESNGKLNEYIKIYSNNYCLNNYYANTLSLSSSCILCCVNKKILFIFKCALSASDDIEAVEQMNVKKIDKLKKKKKGKEKVKIDGKPPRNDP